MSILPKIKECPVCGSYNLIGINGLTFENNFQSLADWTLKKKLSCRKCHAKLGLFLNNSLKKDKLIWIDYLMCEDIYFNDLNKLQLKKEKYKSNKKKFDKTLDEIRNIQNEIQLKKVKLKIKFKIETQGMLIRHVH